MFEGKMLGTRDIQRILKKRGINIGMEAIVHRLKKGFDLFATSERDHIKWKGKFRSFVDIAKMEGIGYGILKHRFYDCGNIRKAVDISINVKPAKIYDFEGKQLRKFEIVQILAERFGITYKAMLSRVKKRGINSGRFIITDNIKADKHAKKTLRKCVYAIKDGVEQKFDSIQQAATELHLLSPNVSQAVNGKQVHCGGYKFRVEGGV